MPKMWRRLMLRRAEWARPGPRHRCFALVVVLALGGLVPLAAQAVRSSIKPAGMPAARTSHATMPPALRDRSPREVPAPVYPGGFEAQLRQTTDGLLAQSGDPAMRLQAQQAIDALHRAGAIPPFGPAGPRAKD